MSVMHSVYHEAPHLSPLGHPDLLVTNDFKSELETEPKKMRLAKKMPMIKEFTILFQIA